MAQMSQAGDLTSGPMLKKIILFSLPLAASSFLQLLFNAVDIIVVGRFTGSQARAAVGSTTALINMFVNLFIGVSLGANVLSARFYAAGKEREMSETVHTAMTFALISGIVMVFVGLFCTRGALELMDTDLLLFKLYEDGAEGMIETKEEILSHDGLFGVERDSWMNYLNAQSQNETNGMTLEM